MSDTMKVFDKIYSNGIWRTPEGQGSLEVINATTEVAMGSVPACIASDVDVAMDAARGAFDSWSATSVEERAQWLLKIHEALALRSDEIAETITAEVGTTLKISKLVQAGSPIHQFKSAAKLLTDYAFSETIGHSLVVKEPIGVVGCITPWNYPLHQVAAKVAPALAAGCCVVLKPSEVAPLSAFILAQVIADIGLPKGVFNLVTGTGKEVGEAIATHPQADMISFTGSTGAGRRVSELAAQTIKRVSLELGGKSASLVLEDGDMKAAVKSVFNSCFINAGQTCNAHTRLLVPEHKYDEVKALLATEVTKWPVGNPLENTTRVGPLVSEVQWGRVQELIGQGIDEGAELIAGGCGLPDGIERGYFVQPTILGRVKPTDTLAREEVFGPVLCVLTFNSEAQAIEIANDSIYGLSGAVWCENADRALSIARRLRTGMVDVNGAAFNPRAPFGGYKQSGNGREFGVYGFEEFLELKAIQL